MTAGVQRARRSGASIAAVRATLAFVAAVAIIAATGAEALTCRCDTSTLNTGTCTYLTLVDDDDGTTPCNILSGTTLTANITIANTKQPLVFDLTSSGATTLVGNLKFRLTRGGSNDKLTTINLGSVATIDGCRHQRTR